MKILVTGANGQLGKCLQDVASAFPDFQCYFLGRDHFAIDQFGMVANVLHALQPNWVINAAAYTAVDKAEQEPTLAYLINGESVGNLAQCCSDVGARLLHVSTDYVFDGTQQTPYQETDSVNPIGVYGKSKLMGEELALLHAPDSIIVRTSWVYSRHGSNFVKTMLRLMKEKESIGVVADQFGCPTYAIDLATALFTILQQPLVPSGIYHFSNSGPISWHQFALAIASLTGSKCLVKPLTTAEYPTLAKRPDWSVLSNEKLASTFKIAQKDWYAQLKVCLDLL